MMIPEFGIRMPIGEAGKNETEILCGMERNGMERNGMEWNVFGTFRNVLERSCYFWAFLPYFCIKILKKNGLFWDVFRKHSST